LKFKYEPITIEKIKDYRNWDYMNCSIGLDEIYIYLDARCSMSKRNQILSYFFMQSRKRECRIFGTTQNIFQLDVRLRKMADKIIFCSIIRTSSGKMYVVNEIYNMDMKGKKTRNVFLGNDYFKYYDTKEIIDFS
jgi:hypothetical protein